MVLLLTRVGRELWRIRFRALALALIAASGMAIYTGIFSAIDSLFATRDHFLEQGNAADLEVRFVPEDRYNLPRFDDIPGVAKVESRLVLPGKLALPDGRRLAATLVALDRSDQGAAGTAELERLTLLDGEGLDPERPERVVIERGLARGLFRQRGFGPGDRLLLDVGNDHYDLTVAGVGLSPEYLIASADPSVFLPTKGSRGIVFAPLGLVERRLGFPLVDSLLVRYQPGADPDAVRRAVAERADAALAVEELVPRARRFGSLFLEKDLQAFALFVPAMVVVFAVTAVVVCLFLLFQWITGQRQQIGLLMALGYGKRRLALSYLAAVAGVALLAASVGTALAPLVLEVFARSYAEAVGLPAPVTELDLGRLLGGTLGTVGVLVLAAAWPLGSLLRMTPQDAVRAERSDGAALGGLARRLAARVSGRLWLRYAVRSLLRDRLASGMTVASVALALGVAISYFAAITSFRETLLDRFRDDRWDATVSFLAPVWDDELGPLERVEGVAATEPFVRGSVRVLGAGADEGPPEVRSALVTGIDPRESMLNLALSAGRGLREGDRDVIVLEQHLADELGLAVGERVRLESMGEVYEPRLVGLVSGVLPSAAYAPRETARRWLDLGDQSTGAFLRLSADGEAVRPRLYDLNRVGNVLLEPELERELLEMIEEILAILYVAEAFSIGVAVLFLFSSASFLVLGRRSEYSLLGILGFHSRTVGAMIVGEVLLTGAVAAVLSVPLAYAITAFLTDRVGDAWFTVDTAMGLSDVAVILAPALLLMPLAARPAVRTIRAASLSKTLRERMFG